MSEEQQQQPQQQSQQPQQPQQQPTPFPSAQDYYKRFANPNLFISNNANPFLISPYSPSQVNGTATSTTIRTNTIKPFSAGATIQVEGNMNMVSPYSISLNNSPLYTDRIYSGGPFGGSVQIACDSATNSAVILISGLDQFIVSNSGISLPNSATSVTAGAAAIYMPIQVNGIDYKIQLFNL